MLILLFGIPFKYTTNAIPQFESGPSSFLVPYSNSLTAA